MSDAIQPPLVVPHLNKGLFADYYLHAIVPQQADWQALTDDAARVLAELKTLRSRVQPEHLDEAQLESEWVQPVFEALGQHYKVQIKIRYRDEGNRRPDYLFLNSSEDVAALTHEIYQPAEIAHALAVGDAKKWGINLDQTAKTGDRRNPAQQIDEYLRYSELAWGILTDGRYWRLYHRDKSKYNEYYAVDLEHLLQAGDAAAFRYFYAFFRRQAFVPDGWNQRVLAGSVDYAERLTDTLEDEVYDALELLAQGFLDFRRNQLSADAATLRLIYEQSLVLLYRLLFILYAESRAILPLNANTLYTDQHSLQAIKRRVEHTLRYNLPLGADSSEYYARLRDLFFAIDAGDDRLDMPPYNGRLFSDQEHPFLAAKVVGDAHLVPALDKLARVTLKDTGERVFVDYRDLEVRHLGSIYEKLLEYELDIAREPLTLRDGVYAPAKAGETPVKKPNEVFLRTGSNARKVTGSYYTPDYIVRFIVQKTLDPLLDDLIARHAAKTDEGRWLVRAGQETALTASILALNILDPATGSGHFIVEATAYLAERLTALGLHPADLGAEDENIYWRRQVASACVYALDINPLAVELAKLSMWLTTLAKGKPLSFLDHHLRVGNSLVGARLAEMDADANPPKKRGKTKPSPEAQGQLPMFSDAAFAANVRFAVGQMNAIETTRARTVSDVKQQEQQYADLRARLQRWEQTAHVWTARRLGLAVDDKVWELIRANKGLDVPAVQRLVDEAVKMSERPAYRFFHWELLFPEIFFDADGQRKPDAGFDAVIGNPPYVRQERIQPIKPFLDGRYKVYSGTADLFLYFYELGLEFVKPECRVGFITSGTYMNSNSAKPFRAYINQQGAFEEVVNFGENQPFKGAEMVYPTMAILRRGKPKPTFKSLFVEDVYKLAELDQALDLPFVDTAADVTALDEWRFQPVELTRLFQKITKNYQTLGEITKNCIYRGVTTGLNEAFIIDAQTRQKLIDEHTSSAEIIKPVTQGELLRPWYQTNGQYIIRSQTGINISSYPAIEKHLEQYRKSLAQRYEAAKGQIEWFELRPCDYYDEFEKSKIVWADICKLPRFSWNESSYLLNTGFMIPTISYHLLALLQSRALWFAVTQISTPLRLRAGLWQYRVLVQNVERLPIPELSGQQAGDLAALAEEMTGLARQRYTLHEDFRTTLSGDFGAGKPVSSRVALYDWWNFASDIELSAELQRQFKQDIPLKKRTEWRSFLAEQKAEHARFTAQIIERETRLNAIVYEAFALTPDEIALIEQATKYPYGAV